MNSLKLMSILVKNSLVILMMFVLASCSERSFLVKETEKILDDYLAGKYESAYQCRPERFRRNVSWAVYSAHVDKISIKVDLVSYSVTGEEKSDGYNAIKYSYVARIDGLKTKYDDAIIWKGEGEDRVCVDFGFRFFYALNSPVVIDDK